MPKRRLAVVGWVLEGLRGAITSLALAAREHGVVFLLRCKTGVRAASVLVVCGVRRLPGCRRRSASLWVYKFTFQFCSCAFPPHLSVVPALLSACPDAVGGAASPGPWPQAPKQLSQVCEQHRGASCHGQGEAAHHGPASWLLGGRKLRGMSVLPGARALVAATCTGVTPALVPRCREQGNSSRCAPQAPDRAGVLGVVQSSPRACLCLLGRGALTVASGRLRSPVSWGEPRGWPRWAQCPGWAPGLGPRTDSGMRC